MQICVPPSEPTSIDTVQVQVEQRAGPVSGSIYSMHSRTCFPELMLLATAPPWPIPLRKYLLSQRWGTLWHPSPGRIAILPRSARASYRQYAKPIRPVRLAFPQVQVHPVNFNQGGPCPCISCGNRSPAGEGCDIAGPSSQYEVRVCQPLLHCGQKERWVTTNLGSVSFDLCASQAAVQDVDAETHFRVHPSRRLVCSDRPEGCVLLCFMSHGTRHSCDSCSRVRYVNTSSCLSGNSASWVFGSIGERANSCQCRGSLFSAWS